MIEDQNESVRLSLSNYEGAHTFWPVSTHICTLPYDSFEVVENATTSDGIMDSEDPLINLSTVRHIMLKCSSLSFIKELLNTNKKIEVCDDEKVNESAEQKIEKSRNDYWEKQDCIVLKLKDKQEVLRGKELNDVQINAFQFFIEKRI